MGVNNFVLSVDNPVYNMPFRPLSELPRKALPTLLKNRLF